MKVGSGIWLAVASCCLFVFAPAAAALTPRGPDPAVRQWPAWPYQTTCGSLAFDPVVAFSGPTEAELGSLPSEIALRGFLRAPTMPSIHTSSWRLVAESEDTAEFAYGRLSTRVEWLSFKLIDGAWRYSGYASGCRPQSIVRRGPVVTWALAGNQTLTPKTRRVRVNLAGGPCSGGRSQNDHAHPLFRSVGGKLLMTIWLDPVGPGPHTCQGLVEPSLIVKLHGRLGDRELFDGGTYPPRSAFETRPH
jgi:hypothetical protein